MDTPANVRTTPSSAQLTVSQIPRIREPAVLAWTPDYDDGDVAYIAGTPHPPGPPPPSATSASTLSVETIREGQSHPNPSPALTSSSASEMNGHWTSALSLAHATVGEGSIPEVSILEENAPSTLQEERPPDYVEALLPTTPMDYTFRSVEGDSHSMVVVPPMDVTDTRPLYHIRVVHDLFDPSFFVTSIRKGSNDGYFVGDFKTKPDCSALEETVYFKRTEDHIFKKLIASTKRDEFQWKLQHADGGSLLWKWGRWWTCRYVPGQMVSKNKSYDIVAQFYPARMRSPSNTQKLTQMTMEPSGQKYFDEIILSVLILERKRKKILTHRS